LVTPNAPAKTYNVNIVVELASGQKIQLPSLAPNGCEVMIPAASQQMPKNVKPTKKQNRNKDSSRKQAWNQKKLMSSLLSFKRKGYIKKHINLQRI